MYEPIRIKYNLKLFNTTAQLLIHFDAIDNREGQVFEPLLYTVTKVTLSEWLLLWI